LLKRFPCCRSRSRCNSPSTTPYAAQRSQTRGWHWLKLSIALVIDDQREPGTEYLRNAEAKAAFSLGLALLHRGDVGAALAPLQRAEDLRRLTFDAKRSLALADVLPAQVSARIAQHDRTGAKRALKEARAIHA
jgi:hypothetical protein